MQKLERSYSLCCQLWECPSCSVILTGHLSVEYDQEKSSPRDRELLSLHFFYTCSLKSPLRWALDNVTAQGFSGFPLVCNENSHPFLIVPPSVFSAVWRSLRLHDLLLLSILASDSCSCHPWLSRVVVNSRILEKAVVMAGSFAASWVVYGGLFVLLVGFAVASAAFDLCLTGNMVFFNLGTGPLLLYRFNKN